MEFSIVNQAQSSFPMLSSPEALVSRGIGYEPRECHGIAYSLTKVTSIIGQFALV